MPPEAGVAGLPLGGSPAEVRRPKLALGGTLRYCFDMRTSLPGRKSPPEAGEVDRLDCVADLDSMPLPRLRDLTMPTSSRSSAAGAGSAVSAGLAESAVSVHYERIRSEVLDGTFPPGTLLLETTLSRRYDISRTPVREALGLLAQDGLLERTRRGFLVRTRTAEEILDLYDARIALESTAARLAAERRSQLELDQLERLIEYRRAAADADAVAEANRQWHAILRSAAHSETIGSLLEQVGTQLAIYRPAFTMRSDANSEVNEHIRITMAIRVQDAEEARLAMIAHLEVGRELRVRTLLEDLG